MRYRHLPLLLLLLFACSIYAQKVAILPVGTVKQSAILKLFDDTLLQTRYRHFGFPDSLLTDSMRLLQIEKKDRPNNPYYYRLFVPLAYYYAPIDQAFNSKWQFKEIDSLSVNYVKALLPIDKKNCNQAERIAMEVNKLLLNTYFSHPEWVVNTEEQISKVKMFKQKVVEQLPSKTNMISLFNPDPVDTNVGEMELLIRRPNFWRTGGGGSLQLSQNFISKNWHKGGESSNNMFSHLALFAKFDDKQRLEFDNEFEGKVGFNTVPSDTLHTFNVNTDVLKFSTKLGVKAVARWYYTISGEFNTQFFSSYKVNTNEKLSAFLAPANVIVSVGMDYKLNKKKIELSLFVAPATYNFRYVGGDKVDVTRYGVKAGKHTLNDIGSKFQSKMTWKIIPAITWESRFYYFTNYAKVESEWENTFNFVLNRYLSTKLFVHARFDDGITRKTDMSYFQMKEYLSFGLNYNW